MVSTPRIHDRRTALATIGAALLTPWATRAAAKANGRVKVITMLGDSITAGYGLAAADALPAQLSVALARLGVANQVRGAGVSGDTSTDALARVDFSVQADSDLVLVELGGNDLLQGVEPSVLKHNLTAIIRRLKARKLRILLAGMHAPLAIGQAYARQFDAVYPAVAHAEGVRLYPFLLDGVSGIGRLNQKDGIHPSAAGVKIIAERLAPVVAQALKAHI